MSLPAQYSSRKCVSGWAGAGACVCVWGGYHPKAPPVQVDNITAF